MDFVSSPHEAKHPLPRVRLDQHAPPADTAAEPRTVLIKRDGSKFTKRCALHISWQATSGASRDDRTGAGYR